jgi:hypothetical protein
MSPTQLAAFPQVQQVIPRLGDVVRVRTPWFQPIWPIWHYGIVVENYRVIHCSMKLQTVAIESWDEFRLGQPVEIVPVERQLPVWEVIHNAKSRLGEKWNLWDFNCEHFWMQAHGLEPQSPQLQWAVLGLIGLGVGGALLYKYNGA